MVAALVFLGVTCAAAGLFAIIACNLLPYTYRTMKNVFAVVALVVIVGGVASFVTSYSIYIRHWNQTCHRMGGILYGTQNCVKGPIKEIDVP